MPDVIDPTDALLIERAIAAGKVRAIPYGTSGVPLPEYRDGRLTDGPKMHLRARIGRELGSAKRKPTSPEVARRRLRVREAVEAGRTNAEIAAAENICVEVIRRDRRAMA